MSLLLLSSEQEQYVFQGNCTRADYTHLETTLYQDAASILCRDLLIQRDQSCLQTLDLHQIHDQEWSNGDNGYSFVNDERNNIAAYPIVLHSQFKQVYYTPLQCANTASRIAVQKYETRVHAFLERLLALILLDGQRPDGIVPASSGPVTDLPGLRFANSVFGLRNIIISDGKAMLSTQKGDTISFRILSENVSRLLVLYLTCVRPFVTQIANGCSMYASEFLFPSQHGHWDIIKFCNIIDQQSRHRLGKALSLLDINSTLVRYIETALPAFFTLEMQNWLFLEQSRCSTPLSFHSSFDNSATFDASFGSWDTDSFGTPSPAIQPHLSQLSMQLPVDAFGELLYPEDSYLLQPFSMPVEQEFIQTSWRSTSPCPSSPSDYSPQTPTGDHTNRSRLPSSPSGKFITATNWIDATPPKFAAIFRSHGEVNHRLLFVNEEGETIKNKGRQTGRNAVKRAGSKPGPRPVFSDSTPAQLHNTRGRPRRSSGF